MLKKIMRSRFMQALIGRFVAAYMVLIKYSTRWEFDRSDISAPVIEKGKGLIALTWHSRFMMLNCAWDRKTWPHPHVLISRSRDGEIVAKTCEYLGLSVIRGSAKKVTKAQDKGGAKAGRDIIETLDNGGCVVITPDGPRGPRQRLGLGPLRLARLSGHPILPCLFAVKNRKQFKSWDRFVLPLPFGRGSIIWGTPQYISPETSDEALDLIRAQIETEMNALLALADQRMGHSPVEAAS
ncbi:MAG: lysophospholipid acyltransferase family protein [Maricaulaceae bacterium]